MPETAIAFARLCLCGVETAVAFAGAGRASTETGVAFAGAKCVFLVHFSGAEVMVVSMVAVQGRAVVMSVSKSPWAGSRARKIRPARPDVRASAKKFALLGLMVGVSAKKFALLDLMCVRARKSSPCSLITPQIRRFCACWANFFAEMPLEARCWASFFAIQQS